MFQLQQGRWGQMDQLLDTPERWLLRIRRLRLSGPGALLLSENDFNARRSYRKAP